MKAAIVILNWNGISFLQQFLPTLIKYSPSWARIVVADNASTDGSVEWLQQVHPSIEIIVNDKNYGFAGGYNEALKQVREEFLVLLNSDIEVAPGWLEPVINLLELNKHLAAAQPKILAWHQQTHFEYAGAAGGFIDKDYYAFCRGRLFENLEEDRGQYDNACEVAWATGACLVIRKKCFEEVGGFDADFFAHMEEIDLCLRLKNHGYGIGYAPDGVVYHVGGGTLNKQSPFKLYLNFRNNLFLITKNHFESNLFLKLFWRMKLDGVAGIQLALKFQFKLVGQIIKAHFHFYRALPSLLKKRKAIKASRKQPNTNGFYPKSIIWRSFVKGQKTVKELQPGLVIVDLKTSE